MTGSLLLSEIQAAELTQSELELKMHKFASSTLGK